MNEREFILRMVIALANKSGYNEFEAAKEFAAEARKRGLFEAAPLTPYGESLLAQTQRDLAAAKALLREMAEFLIRNCGVTSKEEDDRFRELYSRAKEMTND